MRILYNKIWQTVISLRMESLRYSTKDIIRIIEDKGLISPGELKLST